MKIVHGASHDPVAAERFTGSAELEMLHLTGDDNRPDIALVHHHEGAVSVWHTHPGGQNIFVVSGHARIGTDADGEVALEPGALVVTPADERHWHGAADGHDATLLAMTWGATAWSTDRPV
jgi:quercetin dioxygenase-like cupin family protein